MTEYCTAQVALEALPEIALGSGVKNYQICPLPVVEQEFAAARYAGAQFVAYGSPEYPALLAQISDPPPFFWAIGDMSLAKKSCIGLVGSRNVSSLGTRMARKLAGDIGKEGHVVVSGLARGVDTAAHLAALETGTIAVMASGVDVIYPSENTVLGEEIGRQGLRISEAPMGMSPQARHFPQRNRIISALSRGVVVVEAAARSGSLITARTALDQGREVFAVPGHPFDARASGCNMLIRDGATLARGANDVIEAIGPGPETDPAPDKAAATSEAARPAPCSPPPRATAIPAAPSTQRSLKDTLPLHQQILDRLGPSPMAEDQLIRDLARPASEVAPELVSLELEGRIQRQPGGLLAKLV